MGLLAPWFIAGLGLLGLPLYLHLLKRHRSQPQHFSSLMFFEKSTRANLRHRRLDFLVLLTARLALLSLVALAFAQPFLWRAGAGPAAGGRRMIIVDTSASMGYGDRISRARAEAVRLITPESRTAFFDSRLRMAGPEEIQHAAVTGSRGSLGELARALRAYQETEKVPLDVHFISDLQRSSMPPGFSDLRLGPGASITLHSVAGSAEPNWTVESVTAPSRVRDGSSAKVQAVIAGFHTKAARVTAVLEVNGRAVARQPADVPASGRARVEFTGLDVPYGFAQCAVSLEPGDALKADDRYHFAVERTDPLRVVFIGRAPVFFRDALDASTRGAYAVDLSGAGIGKAAFVVLSDQSAWDEAALKSYVQRGGALLVLLGPSSVAAGRVPVTGQRITAGRYASRAAERFQTAGTMDESYPPVSRAARWQGVRFFHFVEVEAGTARVIVRLSGGAPLLMEQTVGAGKVVVMTSALDNLASDFPTQPAFVPFVEQLAHQLSGWRESAVAVAVDTVLDVKGGRQTLDTAGFHEFFPGGGRKLVVAVNVDRRESDLEPMPADSAELWQAGPRAGAEQSGSGGAQQRHRRPLAAWLLGLALAAGLAEVFIARTHLNREAA
ncbi:MAG: BatA domain-containing protein [Candidatus Solibacter usitatus]|nr:BatA domain-containing protein [Candidatus Solibacter usitatus]